MSDTFRDYADKSYLTAPPRTPQQQRLAAARKYLHERQIHTLLPRTQCKLDYVKSEHGSRLLKEFARARSVA